MSLNESDELRLNVLLAQNPTAIKINESTRILYALTEKGEAKIELHPDCKTQIYMKKVREFLSTHVLGSPGGYPIYLRRWTRMGQARDESLARLLLLGEDEAVTAVVHAQGLSLAIACNAWWVLPNAHNARQMLQINVIAQSELGAEMSAFLLEFLPFEDDQQAMIESVRLVLQSDHMSPQAVQGLWRSASRKTSYYIGFLRARADDLPGDEAAHPLHVLIQQLCLRNNNQINTALLELFARVLSPSGQRYLKTVKVAFAKPNNQDVVVSLLNTLGDYFKVLNNENRRYRDLRLWNQHTNEIYENCYSHNLAELPFNAQVLCRSMIALSMVDETMINPIFGVSDAIGTVMRKKIKPICDEILFHVDRLYETSIRH